MSDADALHEEALQIWDKARAEVAAGDKGDMPRLMIEAAFELFEERISSLERELAEARDVLVSVYENAEQGQCEEHKGAYLSTIERHAREFLARPNLSTNAKQGDSDG